MDIVQRLRDFARFSEFITDSNLADEAANIIEGLRGAVAAEREECAKIADGHDGADGNPANVIAEDIRARERL